MDSPLGIWYIHSAERRFPTVMRVVEGHVIYDGAEKLKQRIERAKANVGIDRVFGHFGFEYRMEGNFCCPFHSDDSPSARFYDDGQHFKCFAGSCAFSGDVVKVAKRILGCSTVGAVEFLEATYWLYDTELPELDTEISLSRYRSQCEAAVMDYYCSIHGKLGEADQYRFEQSFVSSYEERLLLNAWFCKNGQGNVSDYAEVQKWVRSVATGLAAWERLVQ